MLVGAALWAPPSPKTNTYTEVEEEEREEDGVRGLARGSVTCVFRQPGVKT